MASWWWCSVFASDNIYKGNTSRAIQLFLSGVALAVLAAVIFTARISISKWFNYIDISHVLMAGTAVFFYHGARLIALKKV
ncbi:MAG: hypothetical protein U5L96_10645 [Owenweeksia sp.]|nr:hypothetical protein [Owenweeksia sp.]